MRSARERCRARTASRMRTSHTPRWPICSWCSASSSPTGSGPTRRAIPGRSGSTRLWATGPPLSAGRTGRSGSSRRTSAVWWSVSNPGIRRGRGSSTLWESSSRLRRKSRQSSIEAALSIERGSREEISTLAFLPFMPISTPPLFPGAM